MTGSTSSRPILAGLIGRDIQLSRSPEMHEAEARAQGFALEYRLFDFAAMKRGEADLLPLLQELAAAGYAGVNVTHPYKQAVIPLLDELSPGAASVGAVNTVAFRDGRRMGFNTDVTGFAASFRLGLPNAATGTVFQAGGGGAGSATADALLTLGTGCLLLHDPDAGRAAALVDRLCASHGAGRARVAGDVAQALAGADGIVNATPIGMAGHPGIPVPADLLRPHHWVADVVYFPLETELLRNARALGCRVLDGGGMAVWQAAGAFEIFTGRTPDGTRMRERFLAAIG